MSNLNHYQTKTDRRKIRVRSSLKTNEGRTRLTVFRSNQHFYLQLVDGEGRTVVTCSDVKKVQGTKTESAEVVAKEMVEQLKKHKIKAVVIDRGAYKYHGRVKAAVEVIRQAGIEV